MRHRKSFNHLGRTSSHRKAMLSNMATSLILHKRITTTVAKAKALRGYVEPLITKSKSDTTHARRVVFSYLRDKFAVAELFRDVSAKIADRPGGYTRVIKLGKRLGDNAEMAMIELVDYNELLISDKSKKTKSTRRRRGGSKSSVPETEVKAKAADVVEDAVVEEVVEVPAKEETKETVTEETIVEKEEKKEVVAEEVVEEVKAAVEDIKEDNEEALTKTENKEVEKEEDEKKE
jgi:large subunit ribosomal protein L17